MTLLSRKNAEQRVRAQKALQARKSLQQVLKGRIAESARRDKLGREPLPMLGLDKVTLSNVWLLERILVDAPEHERQKSLAATFGIDTLHPCLLDITAENWAWCKSLHEETFQSLSYILNRLIESCRYDTPWLIEAAKPEEVVKALGIVQEFTRGQYARNARQVSASSVFPSKEESPEPRHGDDRA